MASTPYRDQSQRLTTPTSNGGNINNETFNPRRKFRRRSTSESHDRLSRSGHEEEDRSDMSDDSEHELDPLDSEIDDDEETGLPAEERRKFLRRQRWNNRLDRRVAGTSTGLSEDDQKQADKHVMRTSIVNACLIASWYFFSLSISIVCDLFVRPSLNLC